MTTTDIAEAPAPTSAVTRRRPPTDALAGLGAMIRLVVRRNRVRLAVWWLVMSIPVSAVA